MKYLFMIHSHTCFLTSLGVVDYLKLKNEDIVFVYARNYKNNLDKLLYREIDFSFEYTYCHRRPYYFRSLKKMIRLIDEKVSEITNCMDYIMFAPNPGGARFFQIILSNPKCKGMNYIQEGALVFDKLFRSKRTFGYYMYRLYDSLLYPFYKHRIWANRFNWRMPVFMNEIKKEPECFAISSDIFSKLPYKNNIIKWPVFEIEYIIEPKFPCFVFESSIEMGVIEKNIYMDYSRKLINEKAGYYNYVKFHPAQSKENIEEIKSYFEKLGKRYEELPMIPFELYLAAYKKMKVYGFNSSLLVFAKQLNHETYSLESELLMASKKYKKWRLRL